MTTERRKAPRRSVTKIERAGSWGNVIYRHFLSCGHVEERKRAASTPELACTWCPKAEQKEQEIKALSRPGILVAYEPNLADQELKIESSRAAIAQRLGVPLDAVDIASEDIAGELIIRSATIYLSARDVARIVDSR
jgi:hypothetical protein